MTWYLFEFQLGMVTLDRLCLRLVDFQTLVFGWVPTIPTVFGLTWHWRFHIKFWSDILVILNLKGFQWCRRRQTVVRINGVALLEIKDPNLGLTGVKNDQMSHYFRNLPVNGHDLYDTENCHLKLSRKMTIILNWTTRLSKKPNRWFTWREKVNNNAELIWAKSKQTKKPKNAGKR